MDPTIQEIIIATIGLHELESKKVGNMLTELKAKSQVTIPKRIVNELGLEQGDLFEVIATDGSIKLVPVVVWPKNKVEELECELAQARKEREDGSAQICESADNLLSALHQVSE